LADLASMAQLTPAQGAGTGAIEPVRQVDTSRSLLVGMSNIFESVGDYIKSEKDRAKQEAKTREEAVIKSFIKDENKFAQMLESGQISPAQAAARSRANFREYANSYGEFIGELEKAAKALKGNTELSEAEKQLEAERIQFNNDRNAASQAGFLFVPGMTRDQEMAQIRAHKADVIAGKEAKERREIAAEERAQGTYNAQLDAKREKDAAFNTINSVAGANLEAYQKFIVSLGNSVRSGKMSPDEARALNLERYNNISASIQAAARVNTELAAPFRSLFEEINKVGEKLIDPKTATEDLQNKLKQLTTTSKLTAMADPEVKAAIVAYELFPNSPTITLGTSKEAMKAITLMASDPKDGKFIPQVVGDPKVEGETVDFLKAAIKDIPTKDKTKQEAAMTQAGNSVNNLLKQTSKFIDEGADPKKLSKLADFYASPEYAVLVNNGKIDMEAAQAAKKVFQLNYEQALVKGVQDKLTGYLFDPKGRGKDQIAPIAVKDAVDVKFTGSGIVFEAKPIHNIYGPNQPPPIDIERRKQQDIVKELNTAQKAINQLIHIGAHMEGTINYAKYWEANKHLLIPSMFSPPEMPTKPSPSPAAAPAAPSTKNWWEQ